MKKTLITLYLLVSFLLTSPVLGKDLSGSKDHPLIERYPGSKITKYEKFNFDRYSIALSAPNYVSPKVYEAKETLELEGKITRLVYSIESETTNYEIYKNYLDAFKRENAQILYTCFEEECNERAKSFIRFYKQKTSGGYKDKALPYYTVAKFDRADLNDVYAIVLNGSAGRWNHIMIHIVETKALELGKVKTNANALLKSLDTKGKAKIYDIHFDTGNADIKTESHPAISEIAKVLKERADLSLYVVGHTDDTGTIATNQNLSDARAKAITKYLIKTHKIDKQRLYGVGAGPFAPAASNESEQGRAKNRRVEIVKRLK